MTTLTQLLLDNPRRHSARRGRHTPPPQKYNVITVIVDAHHRLVLPVKEPDETFESLMAKVAEYWSIRKEDYYFEYHNPAQSPHPLVLVDHQRVSEMMRLVSPRQDWRIHLRMSSSLRHEVEYLLHGKEEAGLLVTPYNPEDKRHSQDAVGARRRAVDAEARRIRATYKWQAYAVDFGVRLAVLIFTVVALTVYYPGNAINTIAQVNEKRLAWPVGTYPTLQSYIDARFPFLIGNEPPTPVRLRQLRVRCEADPVVSTSATTPVCPGYSASAASTSSFGGPNNDSYTYVAAVSNPVYYATSLSSLSDSSELVADYDNAGGFYLFLNVSTSSMGSPPRIPPDWIDEATRVVFIEFNRYDPSSNLFAAVKIVAQYPPWLPPRSPLSDPVVLVRADKPPARSPRGYDRAVAVCVLLSFAIFAAMVLLMSEVSIFRVFPLRDEDLAQLGFSARGGKSIGLLNAALAYKRKVEASMPSLLGFAPGAMGPGADELWQMVSGIVDICACALMIAAVALVGQSALDDNSRSALQDAAAAGGTGKLNYTEIYGVLRGENEILALLGASAWLSVMSFAVRFATILPSGMMTVRAVRGGVPGLFILLALTFFPLGLSFAVGGTTVFSAASTPAFRTLSDAVYSVVTTKFLEDVAPRADASDWVLYGTSARVYSAAVVAWLFIGNLFATCVVVVVVEGVWQADAARRREEEAWRREGEGNTPRKSLQARWGIGVVPGNDAAGGESSSIFATVKSRSSSVRSFFFGGAGGVREPKMGGEEEEDAMRLRRAEAVSSRGMRVTDNLADMTDPTHGVLDDLEGWSDGGDEDDEND